MPTPAASTESLILGIDPGLDRTGYAVVSARPRSVVDAGIITTDSDAPLASRLLQIDRAVEEILSEHVPGLVAVEDLYAHYKHPRTAIFMGHARGVVLAAAARHGRRVVSLPATTIKKTLTGNGHAGKTQMQRAIAAALNLSVLPEPADVADAIAVAFCAAAQQETGSAAAARKVAVT